VGTLYGQLYPSVIYDFSVKPVDLMFRVEAGQSDLGLLDSRDVVVGYSRSEVRCIHWREVQLTFMVN
jgi:hypothetical protein